MTRVLVIGPGALGLPTAVRLQAAGHDVTIAVRDAAKAALLASNGCRVTDPDGHTVTATVPTAWRAADVEPVDVILHTTKCHGAAEVLAAWMPALAPGGAVVPFQNGLMADVLGPVAGAAFMECSVYWPATLVEAGHSHVTGVGHNVVGPWPNGEPEAMHAEVANLLSAVVPTHVDRDMQAVKWSKLIVNSAMTSLGVVTGETMRGMMADKPTRAAFLAVIREGLAVMEAKGITPVTVGNSRPGLLAKLPDVLGHGVLRVLARKYGDYRSSSAQSLARGEPTEVDFLNGEIVRAGKAHGVATPVNAAIVDAVHAIEAGAMQGANVSERLLATA